MKRTKPQSEEYLAFSNVLRTVLKVSKPELDRRIAEDNASRANKPKRGPKPKQVTQKFRVLGPIPKPRCPVCNADIDVSKARYSETLSICHGTVTVYPVPGTLVCTLDFCIS
jgi:hypothetical protein